MPPRGIDNDNGESIGIAKPAVISASESDRDQAVSRTSGTLGLESEQDRSALAHSYDTARRFTAPFVTSVAADMLDDMKREAQTDPERVFVFVGRDGHSFGLAIRELDKNFHDEKCRHVVLSRAAAETALQDLECTGKTFAAIEDFRGARNKVDLSDVAGARARLTDYLHRQGVPVGRPDSKVTLVDSSYKGTVQELLQATYPDTKFDGKYAFFAASPHDPHPQAKRGYDLHLDAPNSFGGRPVAALPADHRLTFAHQDALGCIEETLHGPLGSPKSIGATGPVQSPQRHDTKPLAGLNPTKVNPIFTSSTVREGCKHVNLAAVRDHARHVAAVRDAGGDWRGQLASGRENFRTETRAWINGTPSNKEFGGVMDSFVRRADKAEVNRLSAAIDRFALSGEAAREAWRQFDAASTVEAKRQFIKRLGEGK